MMIIQSPKVIYATFNFWLLNFLEIINIDISQEISEKYISSCNFEILCQHIIESKLPNLPSWTLCHSNFMNSKRYIYVYVLKILFKHLHQKIERFSCAHAQQRFLGKNWKKMEMNGFTYGIMKVDSVINASNWVDVLYSGPLFVSQFSFFLMVWWFGMSFNIP